MKRTILAVLALASLSSFAAKAEDQVVTYICGNDYVQVRASNSRLDSIAVNNNESQNTDIVHQAQNGVGFTNVYAVDMQRKDRSGWILSTSSRGAAVFSHVMFEAPMVRPYKFKVIGQTVRCTAN